MTALLRAAGAGLPTEPAGAYRSGICNIGPAEIARRRRTGITMTIVTVALLEIMVAVHAPATFRLIAFLTAAVAASGFLQAYLKFCAGFGWLGVFNFDDLGTTQSVGDEGARRRDRSMALRIGLASGAVGAVVALVAVLLPA